MQDFAHEGELQKSTIQTTTFCTKENNFHRAHTKKHELEHDFCTEGNTKEHDLEHDFCTEGNTKEHDLEHDFCTEENIKEHDLEHNFCTKEHGKMNEFPCAPFEEVFIGNQFSDCYRG